MMSGICLIEGRRGVFPQAVWMDIGFVMVFVRWRLEQCAFIRGKHGLDGRFYESRMGGSKWMGGVNKQETPTGLGMIDWVIFYKQEMPTALSERVVCPIGASILKVLVVLSGSGYLPRRGSLFIEMPAHPIPTPSGVPCLWFY